MYNSALALRQALENEQGLDLAKYYDSKINTYETESLNIHKMHTALLMRADTAIYVLSLVDMPKAKSLQDNAALLRVMISGGYQIAELWSMAELDAVSATLNYYMNL
mgnify:CR=1 FL=1